ncbi:TetR/AcrR family transcriptional regulator [Solihabitans fulvus]|uniref:TetR/AcrR family transcriptional regulator n=1 Tax=Solihabitans fulvus TaxID=1892852 RepID=A0A5B2W8S5_9PSEU|nr:TetR/AcrR family transcriptional regulator [Solihabitans fulvus]KAA2246757.1 TetR/AcrR family transcriptional regulator [Solihabitans fulvus]
MSRQEDQAMRRRQIAEAMWRVTVARSLEGTSMRHVAAEAGVSVGMMQHYFRTKDEMLLFALDSMTEQVSRRIGERFAELADPDDPKHQVRAALVETLPLDEERRLEAFVGCAFLTRAAVDTRFADYLRDGHRQGHAYLVEQINRGGRPCDAAEEAHVLLALVNGFTLGVLAGQCTAQQALAAVEARLDALFGP